MGEISQPAMSASKVERGVISEKAEGGHATPGGPNGESSKSESAAFSPLDPTVSRSAQDALRELENFESSPVNPRNWSARRKWKVTLAVSLAAFISTCGSSIGVPGINPIMAEYGVKDEKIGILLTTFYVLGLGCGPFLSAPLSELYGRQLPYLGSLLPYTLFSLATAVAQSLPAIVILRFFCGVFGSTSPTLGIATIADMYVPQQRGRPVSIYACGPMAGPVIGSVLGYWILFGGWRWLFWAITMFSFINFILFMYLTDETYAPVLEKKLRYRATHPIEEPKDWKERYSPRHVIHNLAWMRAMVSGKDAKEVFQKAFSRPPRLLLFNPVCAYFSIYYAYIYGVAIIYVFLVSTPLLFGSPPFDTPGLFSYQWPQATLSLSYLGMTIGFCIAATIASNMQDRIYRYLSDRAGEGAKGQPEYRLVLTQIGMCILPIGLLIFASLGWTAEAEVHWIAPLIGQAIIALGLMLAFNSIQNFIVDAFFPYSAAAVAAASAARAIAACIVPEFSGEMFHNLGWGWGGTLTAGIAALGIPAPLIMFIWGKQLRERFKFQG